MPRRKADSRVNRVWIEIEWHKDESVRKERAACMTRMLQRLSPEFSGEITAGPYHYRYYSARPGGFVELVDRGEWFNLDWLGREVDDVAQADAD